MKERRECARTEIGSKVECFSGLSTVSYGEEGKSLSGTSVNVSERGIGLVINKPLREHEVFKIMLPLKNADVKIPVLAMVRWVEPYRNKFKAGLMFIA